MAAATLFIEQRKNNSREQLYTLSGLANHIDQIDTITATIAGENVIARLSNINGTWIELGSGYPANVRLIKNILRQLANSKKLVAKTKYTDRFASIGVQDITREEARGIKLKLSTAPNNKLDMPEFSTEIILGDITSTGQFARINNDKQSWLIDTSLDLPDNNIDWVNRQIIDIPAAQLVAITIIHADQTRVELIKPDSAKPKFKLMQDDTNTPVTANPNKIAGILSGLNFESVRAEVTGIEGSAKVTIGKFLTHGGVLITSRTWRTNEGQFFNFYISHQDGGSNINELKRLQERLSGWTYTLPTYKAEQFLTTKSDLEK
ncbi:MAG: DUF4340 domain-containing protein [Gammaproteobacteria bacterium]|nr:DUF4340 domain-containing protein [Gammaproteobacteria bacterium]